MSATHNNAGIAANIHIKTFWDMEVFDLHSAQRAMSGIVLGRRKGPRIRGHHHDYLLASNVYLREVRAPLGYPSPRSLMYIAVVLYETEIVRYYPDGSFSVDNGGFNTITTASRIAQFSPVSGAFHANGLLGIRIGSRVVKDVYHSQRFDVPVPALAS